MAQPIPPGCIIHGRRYTELMKTLTITEGRGRLGFWLKKAVAGEDVGFVFGDKIVGLRPGEVHSAAYSFPGYGLTATEMDKAAKRIRREIKSARARGEVTKFTGSKDDFR